MKNYKMIKSTNQFQEIIDRYHQSLKKRKPKDTLNALFVKDLNQVKGYNNFSDEEYMISEIKNENKIKNEKRMRNNNIFSNYPKNNLSQEKISKDIFFYYRNKLDEKKKNNVKIKPKKDINYNFRYNPASKRMNSGKNSDISISNSYSRNSKRHKSSISLELPLIYPRNYNINQNKKINSKSYISEDDTTPNILSLEHSVKNVNTEISTGKNSDINKNKKIKYSKINNNRLKNNLNTLSIKEMINNIRIKKCQKDLLYKQYIPLFKNDIFNKINIVSKNSNLIKKHINLLSSEGNLVSENEKNRIKFLNDIMEE